MKTIEEARKKWNAQFRDNAPPSDLRTALKSDQGGRLCSDGLRSICWKTFLLFPDLDRSQWPRKLSDSRSAYSALRSHFLKYIEHPDDLQSSIDPLADDEKSPWQTLRCDEAMRADIWQDVERCLQENFFFREPTTKAMMVDILFIYCKLNPDLGYRQGMHELLAPILWVVDRDAVDAQSLDRGPGTDDDLVQLLDSSYIEHDAFALFCPVMQTARIYYEHREQPSTSGHVDTIPIVSRCQYIHHDLLFATDPELAEHLQALDILPQIFLTRWMRLLFGREFPFEDTLMVWDLLFADGLESELVDFVCIAMLLRIRWELVKVDHSSALAMLLRYPSPHPYSPQTFVHDALSLRRDPTAERGCLIISKYSGSPPDLSKRRSQSSVRPTTRKVYPRSDLRDRSESSSPARTPGGNVPRGFEGLLQDVSEGIQRRTETWGVAKAVRGAVTDARKNMHTMQWERPRATRPEDVSIAPRDGNWAHGSNAASDDLKTRIELLEERNSVLAKMLGQAVHDLRADMEKTEDTKSNGAMKQALTRVESVQICMEDSSIPLEFTDTHSSGGITDPKRRTKEEGEEERTQDEQPSTSETSRQREDQTQTSKPRPDSGSAPAGSNVRPSLAASEFSWMLGQDRKASSFASSASLPPEQTRHRTKPLFGNGDEDQRRGSAESDVAMNSLRGRRAG